MRILFVVNPVSGRLDKKEAIRTVESVCMKYGLTWESYHTTGNDDQAGLHQKLQTTDPDRVIVLGGDGTINLTSSVLAGTEYPMGIVPAGSANGLARDLMVAADPEEAFRDAVTSHHIHALDVVMINETFPLIHIGDVGINARIVQAYAEDENRGLATYAKYFLGKLNESEPFDVRITTENGEVGTRAFMVAICNSRRFGTGIPLNPISNPMDGRFEIVIIEKFDAVSLIKAGLSGFDEKFADHENSHVIECTNAQISFDNPMLLQIDGEVIGEFQELDVQMKPRAVKLITHAGNEYIPAIQDTEI